MVEIVKNDIGEYLLHFKSVTGSSLLKSVPFKNQATAEDILHRIVTQPVFERKTNHQGKFIIVLKTASGEQVGQSNTYSSEAGMENGIKNLMRSFS